MRAGTNSRGYTVVEVMIFLAVSGLMFVLAATFISDKQAKAEFKQGMNSLNSDITRVINDVGNGYFPDRGGFSCIAPAAGSLTFPPAGDNAQGTNIGCVFMGKIIEFGTSGSAGSYTGYRVYTVAGRQYKGTASENKTPVSFAESYPAVVSKLTEDRTFDWGITLTKLVNNTQSLSAVGFFTAFGKYDNGLHQANNSTVIVPIPGSIQSFDKNASMTGFDSQADPSPNITMCFESGKGQFGTLTIGGGGGGQRLAVKAHLYESKPGGC